MKISKVILLAAIMACSLSVKAQNAETTQEVTNQQLLNEINVLKAQNEDRALQDKNNAIWKRTKSFNLGMVFSKWKPEGIPAFDPNFGFMMGLTNTYYVHKNPIAGFIKFGIDATWFDLTYVNYKANPAWVMDDDNASDTRLPGGFDVEDEELEMPNLGSHQIDAALGVGVSATFAPFYQFDNQLNQLKGKVYCRFLPTFSAMLISENDDIRFNYAFVPYITFGAQFSWKVLSVFVEGRWGSANYKIGGLNGDDLEFDEDEGLTGDIIKFDKISCKNYGVRFGVALTF